jgi:hypothetical protein
VAAVAVVRQVVAVAVEAAVASDLMRAGPGRILAIVAGLIAMAAGWIIAVLRDDDLSAVFAGAGTMVFVVVFAWPALTTWVRSFNDARRAERAVSSGRVGDAVIERLHPGSLRVNGGRLCELELLVTEPGRGEYRTRTRLFIDESFVAQYGPGASVRVGRPDADSDSVVLL